MCGAHSVTPESVYPPFKGGEIDPEYVLQDARAAVFAIVALKDPFTRRSGFP
jgi:hypothetical protein